LRADHGNVLFNAFSRLVTYQSRRTLTILIMNVPGIHGIAYSNMAIAAQTYLPSLAGLSGKQDKVMIDKNYTKIQLSMLAWLRGEPFYGDK